MLALFNLMKIDKVYFFLAVVTIASAYFWVSSCRHDPGIPAGTPEICFDREVLPIFQNNCAMTGCHGGSGRSRMNLTTFDGIAGEVSAFNPDQSRLYLAIIGRGEGLMPPRNPLTIESRTIIRLWILQGATHTTCPDTTGKGGGDTGATRACFTRDILPILVSNCAMAGCHDAITHKEGYNFSTYAGTMSTVTAGNYSSSRLYQSITGTGGDRKGEMEGIMPPPPASPLSQAAIDSIKAWITYGALNEICFQGCDTINPVTFSGIIWPFMQTTCTGCHSGTSPSGNISLTSYANVQTVANNGQLMNALKGNGVPVMPPSGSLSTCRLRQFELWVNAGALNN